MPRDGDLVTRVRAALADVPDVTKKRMFGGHAAICNPGSISPSGATRRSPRTHADALGYRHRPKGRETRSPDQ
jgi:hypothetical protein